MSNQTTPDLLNETNLQPGEIPKALNVLTILTFIGSAISIIFSLAMPALMGLSKTMLDKASTMASDLPADQLADIEKARRALEITQANLVPLIILGVAGAIGCVIGAIWMRKLKKDGFTVYVASQVVPIVGSAVLMGSYYFADWKNSVGLLIPAIFIFLYARQRKHLVH